MKKALAVATLTAALAACSAEEEATKEDAPAPAPETAAAPVTDPEPAPPAEEAPEEVGDRNAYFGDLHIHTQLSLDAYIFNVRQTPDDAYRYAKGEALTHPAGYDIKLAGPPLDFYAVTDHGVFLGVFKAMGDPDNPLSQHPLASEVASGDPAKAVPSFNRLLNGELQADADGGSTEGWAEASADAWSEIVAAAEKHNDPGNFTTFIAYEFSPVIDGAKMHRNVVFAGSDVPDKIFDSTISDNAEDLWDWLDVQRAEGRDVLAIPHNPNMSNGFMFPDNWVDGTPIDMAYAEQRMRNEPIVEMTQVKGSSETHPDLSPNDEWADFEINPFLIGTTKDAKVSGSYVREAYGKGLKLQAENGFNPYAFGMIGSSDSHLAGAGYTEDNFYGKVGVIDGLPRQRGSVPPEGVTSWDEVPEEDMDSRYAVWSASGLAAVWAEENSREAIFAAFKRKETFATSGPRLKIRLFAGDDLAEDLMTNPQAAASAYRDGVAMGGALTGAVGPGFFAWALRDPNGAQLDRLQIVKVWVDGDEAKEQVFDVACSGGAEPDENHRCPDNGASVDLSDCSLTEGNGSDELKVVWRDPGFDGAQHASYYARVIQNPTCRWSTWDAIRNGTPPRPDVPATVQDRAWSSPIWVKPAG